MLMVNVMFMTTFCMSLYDTINRGIIRVHIVYTYTFDVWKNEKLSSPAFSQYLSNLLFIIFIFWLSFKTRYQHDTRNFFTSRSVGMLVSDFDCA